MDIKQKFNRYEELFFSDFVRFDTNAEKMGRNIPFEHVRYTKGFPVFAYMGDGTINMAHYFQYASAIGDTLTDDVLLETLDRLVSTAADVCKSKSVVKGFLLRDDASVAVFKDMFAQEIMSGYSGAFEHVNEDVCHSPFVSMDQLWNLLPVIGETTFMRECLEHLLNNGGTLYNPYYSKIYNDWTYCNLKVAFPHRIKDRESAPMKVPVKRGAYNPHLLYGFIRHYKLFFDGELKLKYQWFYKMLYNLVVGASEFLIYPILVKFMPVKNNSWHCFYVASEKKGWFGKRMVSKFNKSLKRFDLTPDFWHLAFIYDEKLVDYKALEAWLKAYPEPVNNGNQTTPLVYMTLYSYYKKQLKK